MRTNISGASNMQQAYACYASQTKYSQNKTENKNEKYGDGLSAVYERSEESKNYDSTVVPNGKVVGDVKLSKTAADYYEQLKAKFHNLEFVCVSKDMKEKVQAQSYKYASSKTVVLIDEEKLEKMAVDKEYRKQYEGIIEQGSKKLSELAKKMEESGISVKGFGMNVKDSRVSFFAVMDKGLTDSAKMQAKRIEAKKAAKKETEKKAKKKAEKEAIKENLEEKHLKEKGHRTEEYLYSEDSEDLFALIKEFADKNYQIGSSSEDNYEYADN